MPLRGNVRCVRYAVIVSWICRGWRGSIRRVGKSAGTNLDVIPERPRWRAGATAAAPLHRHHSNGSNHCNKNDGHRNNNTGVGVASAGSVGVGGCICRVGAIAVVLCWPPSSRGRGNSSGRFFYRARQLGNILTPKRQPRPAVVQAKPAL